MNTMVDYKIEILEKRRGSLKLILILYDNGELFFNEIAGKGMNDHTLDKSIKVLEKLKLIERFKIPGKHHKRVYHRLTETGMLIGKCLKEIEENLPDIDINDF